MAGWPAAKAWFGALAVGSLAALALLALTPVVNAALGARNSGAQTSLFVFDLAGISARTGVNQFTQRLGADAQSMTDAAVAECHHVYDWDPFYFANACADAGQGLEEAGLFTDGRLRAAWLAAMLDHPAAYLAHRAAHYAALLRLSDPGLSAAAGQSLPFHWPWITNTAEGWRNVEAGAASEIGEVRRNLGNRLIERMNFEVMFRLMWLPLTWIALTVVATAWAGMRLWRRSDRLDALLFALGLSALAYTALYFVVSVAAQGRYMSWLGAVASVQLMAYGPAAVSAFVGAIGTLRRSAG